MSSNNPVAWSIASSSNIEFTTKAPKGGLDYVFSQWTLEDLVEVLNVATTDAEDATDAELRQQFDMRCQSSLSRLPYSAQAYEAAYECFLHGTTVGDHKLVAAKQSIQALKKKLGKRPINSELWKQIEDICWHIFSDGSRDFRGCSKERLEDLYSLLTTGKVK